MSRQLIRARHKSDNFPSVTAPKEDRILVKFVSADQFLEMLSRPTTFVVLMNQVLANMHQIVFQIFVVKHYQ